MTVLTIIESISLLVGAIPPEELHVLQEASELAHFINLSIKIFDVPDVHIVVTSVASGMRMVANTTLAEHPRAGMVDINRLVNGLLPVVVVAMLDRFVMIGFMVRKRWVDGLVDV